RPSQLLESFAERGQVVMKFGVILGMRHQHTDSPFPLALLRARRQRPRRRAAEQRDELATFHYPDASRAADQKDSTSRHGRLLHPSHVSRNEMSAISPPIFFPRR